MKEKIKLEIVIYHFVEFRYYNLLKFVDFSNHDIDVPSIMALISH